MTETHDQVLAQSGIEELRRALDRVSLAQDPKMMTGFVLETREHLVSIESRMLSLERDPSQIELIHEVFRSFHTIKGLAGFLELADIAEVAHQIETLLDLTRNGKLAISAAVVDMVLQSADYLKLAVGAQPAPVPGKEALILRIQSLAGGAGVSACPEFSKNTPSPPQPAETSSVRVETSKLDYLVEMVGEMVIAQAMIRQNPAITSIHDASLTNNLAQLARVTSEVQRTTMRMRMIPIGQLFQRTGRLIRDLSRKTGKRVELETHGDDTELDKTIAEELSDPLMHMVRNAIDHGIEPPEIRAAARKNPTASLRLAAYHHGGRILIEISDDGRGLDRQAIFTQALKRGLIDQAARLSDNEIFNLIFLPGFSTADHITDMSGRGVGMDVVRKHVRNLRGRIDIRSSLGQGTTFCIKLPLTLAIIDGLVVGVGSEHYIVPISAVRELFRPPPGCISTIQGRDEMALVRGQLLPIVRLYRRFGIQPKSEDPAQSLLVVAECQGKLFCLMVDDVVGKQEVVIKTLGESLTGISGVAGAAILGDGRVGLILDMDGVFREGKRRLNVI